MRKKFLVQSQYLILLGFVLSIGNLIANPGEDVVPKLGASVDKELKRLYNDSKPPSVSPTTVIVDNPIIPTVPCSSTVFWHNASGCNNPGITMDVTDKNIDVIGINALVNGIHVAAIFCDVVISVTNIDSVITGSGNRCDHVITNSARLYLFADEGRKIIFNIVEDLIFRGTQTNGAPLDLMITVSGEGEVVFQIADDENVSFTSDGLGGGGTKFFIIATDSGIATRVTFARTTNTLIEPAGVIVGKNSLITFIADPFAVFPTGIINFDPIDNTTTDVAFILDIQNGGGVNIAIHVGNNLSTQNFTLADIHLDQVHSTGLAQFVTSKTRSYYWYFTNSFTPSIR